jgi:hypothetical protein
LELKPANTGYQLQDGRTFLVCSDYFQVDWTMKGRWGKALDLLRVSVDIHNIRFVQTSGIVHEHTLGRKNGTTSAFFIVAHGENVYLFLTT